jgi:integrase/recombinase XerD
MTSLRQRRTEDMQVRTLAVNTQASYLQQVFLFARHFEKSPGQLRPEQIRDYQVYLTNEKLAPGSVLIAVALRFLYKASLRRNWIFGDVIPSSKKPQNEDSAEGSSCWPCTGCRRRAGRFPSSRPAGQRLRWR